MNRNTAHKSADTYYQDILFEYAIGNLPHQLSLAIASHLPYRPEALKFVQRLEVLGGSIIDSEENNSNISNDLLEQTLDKLQNNVEQKSIKTDQSNNDIISLFGENLSCFPSVLQNYIAGLKKKVEWSELSDKVELMCLSESPEDSTDIFITRIKPGGDIPHHAHDSTELTFVIEGAFSDENGRYESGDLVACEEKSNHHPEACSEKGCLCLCVISKPIAYQFFESIRQT